LTHALNEQQTLLHDALVTFRAEFERGISEYDLINALKSPPYLVFDEHSLGDSLVMFQTHFVLFHCLYLLKNEWREQKIGQLDIGLTRITLLPILESAANIQAEDSLANYYLDWSNLSSTNEYDVETLLDSFWQKMAGADLHTSISGAELNQACITMKIDSLKDMNLPELKQQYRKLQHENHPDKGGRIDVSQSILQAYTQLRRYIIANS
jgi:hypothetical protein